MSRNLTATEKQALSRMVARTSLAAVSGGLAQVALEMGACPNCLDEENQYAYPTHRKCGACGWDSRD